MPASTERVLITGGAGFIGQRLAASLLRRGSSVRILDCLLPEVHGPAPQLPDWLRRDTELSIADLRDSRATQATLEDVDVVVHLAAATATAQSMFEITRTADLNVSATATLLDLIAARPARIHKLIVASSRAIYGEGQYHCERCGPVNPPPRSGQALAEGRWEPRCPSCSGATTAVATHELSYPAPSSPYGVTKLTQELLARAVGAGFGFPVVALRFQNVYGGGQSLTNPYTGLLTHFFSRLDAGQPPQIYEDGQQSRDFVHVDDVVRAIVAALGSPTDGAYNVGSGVATTVMDVARALCEVMDSPLQPVICGQYRLGDIRHSVADTRKASQGLGFDAQIRLRDGLEEFVAWARSVPRIAFSTGRTS